MQYKDALERKTRVHSQDRMENKKTLPPLNNRLNLNNTQQALSQAGIRAQLASPRKEMSPHNKNHHE